MSNLQLPTSSSPTSRRPLKIGITALLLGPACLLVIEPINELIKLFKGYGDDYARIILIFVSVLYVLGIIIALGLGITEVMKSREATDPKKTRSIALMGLALTLLGISCSPIAALILIALPFCFGMC
jgi:hypothetical protein